MISDALIFYLLEVRIFRFSRVVRGGGRKLHQRWIIATPERTEINEAETTLLIKKRARFLSSLLVKSTERGEKIGGTVKTIWKSSSGIRRWVKADYVNCSMFMNKSLRIYHSLSLSLSSLPGKILVDGFCSSFPSQLVRSSANFIDNPSSPFGKFDEET